MIWLFFLYFLLFALIKFSLSGNAFINLELGGVDKRIANLITFVLLLYVCYIYYTYGFDVNRQTLIESRTKTEVFAIFFIMILWTPVMLKRALVRTKGLDFIFWLNIFLVYQALLNRSAVVFIFFGLAMYVAIFGCKNNSRLVALLAFLFLALLVASYHRFGLNWHMLYITYFEYFTLPFHRFADYLNDGNRMFFLDFGQYPITLLFELIGGILFIIPSLFIASFTEMVEVPSYLYLQANNNFMFSESIGRDFNFLTYGFEYYTERFGLFLALVRCIIDLLILVWLLRYKSRNSFVQLSQISVLPLLFLIFFSTGVVNHMFILPVLSIYFIWLKKIVKSALKAKISTSSESIAIQRGLP